MSNYSSVPSCPYCGTRLTEQEIDYIQGGVSVRCRECGSLLARDQFETSGPTPTEVPVSPQRSFSPGY